MDLEIKNRENTIILAGDINTANSSAFETQLNELVDTMNGEIIVDCAELKYITSMGLRVFFSLQKKLTGTSKSYCIINLPPNIKEIFDMTGFSNILTIK